MRLGTSSLFVACTLVWGTTWYAITYQLTATAPEVGVALRFVLAGGAILAWCALAREPIRHPLAHHRLFAAQGLTGFALSYVLIYHAERYIVSGLVATGYALMPLANMLGAHWLFGTPMSRRVALGGALGATGVALVFWPELATLSAGTTTVLGAALTAGAVVLSVISNMVVLSQQRQRLAHWSPLGWAMLYGAAGAALAALVAGRSWSVHWSAPFAVSLVYLALGGSVLAFGAYYALLARVGAARAAYVGVFTPIVALLVSSWFEHFDWQWQTWLGIALVLAGAAAGRPTRDRAPSPATQTTRMAGS